MKILSVGVSSPKWQYSVAEVVTITNLSARMARVYGSSKQHTEKNSVVSSNKDLSLEFTTYPLQVCGSFAPIHLCSETQAGTLLAVWQRKKREKHRWPLKLLPGSHASLWPIFHWWMQIIWPLVRLTRWKCMTALKKRSNKENGIFGEQRYHQLYYY